MSATVSRIARLALLLSLALNIALGAMLWFHAPWRMHHGATHGAGHGPPDLRLFDVRALKRTLPPERQQVLDRAITVHREPLRNRLGQLFEARRALREAIRAENYDRATLDAAFARLREAETATAGAAQAMLGDVLDAATPEERQRLSELTARRSSRGREERRSHDGRATPPHDAN